MKTLCQRGADGLCTQCGKRLADNLRRTCSESEMYRPPEKGSAVVGLGDLTEKFFESFGVTPERYKAAKATVGLDPDCDCQSRKQILNELGEKFGINDVIVAFNKWRLMLGKGIIGE
jgi:hypothetical protein